MFSNSNTPLYSNLLFWWINIIIHLLCPALKKKKKNLHLFLPSCVSFLRLPPFCFMYNVNDTVLFSSQKCSLPIHSLTFPSIVSTSLAPFCSYLWSVATLEIWVYVSVCVCVVQMCEEAHPTHKRARGSIPFTENNNVCTQMSSGVCINKWLILKTARINKSEVLHECQSHGQMPLSSRL